MLLLFFRRKRLAPVVIPPRLHMYTYSIIQFLRDMPCHLPVDGGILQYSVALLFVVQQIQKTNWRAVNTHLAASHVFINIDVSRGPVVHEYDSVPIPESLRYLMESESESTKSKCAGIGTGIGIMDLNPGIESESVISEM